jgi:hypothetical protein
MRHRNGVLIRRVIHFCVMAHNTIAVIADCDDTLAPDTTAQLLSACGVEPDKFFKEETAELVKEGWDPSLAYLFRMLQLADGGPLADLTRSKIEEIGGRLKFYRGVPQCFKRLRTELLRNRRYRDCGITVEFYVITAGIEDLLRASALADHVSGLWGCNFSYDSNGKIGFPRNVVSFTDKTRFLYQVQKGQIGSDYRSRPYAVNEPMEEHERRIPFGNMVYLGDGASDIPCMSLLQSQVQTNKGYVIGILNKEEPLRTWALGYGRRANITVPPDYRPRGHAYIQIRQAVTAIADRIRQELAGARPVPGH